MRSILLSAVFVVTLQALLPTSLASSNGIQGRVLARGDRTPTAQLEPFTSTRGTRPATTIDGLLRLVSRQSCGGGSFCGDGCCDGNETCCVGQGCCIPGTHCCSDGACCRDGTYCDTDGCCPNGEICSGGGGTITLRGSDTGLPAPPPTTVRTTTRAAPITTDDDFPTPTIDDNFPTFRTTPTTSLRIPTFGSVTTTSAPGLGQAALNGATALGMTWINSFIAVALVGIIAL